MQAVEISTPGGPDVLRMVERPMPRPGADDVLVRVVAAGVNFPDTAAAARQICSRRPARPTSRASRSPASSSHVGEHVTRVARRRSRLRARDAAADTRSIASRPPRSVCRFPPASISSPPRRLPETFFTVWTNVFERGRLRADETFLVHGGSGGIGTTAMQLAQAFGARVFATAGTAEKCRACETFGASRAVNYREEDFVAVLKAGDGRTRRRSHPRYGRRRLHAT